MGTNTAQSSFSLIGSEDYKPASLCIAKPKFPRLGARRKKNSKKTIFRLSLYVSFSATTKIRNFFHEKYLSICKAPS